VLTHNALEQSLVEYAFRSTAHDRVCGSLDGSRRSIESRRDRRRSRVDVLHDRLASSGTHSSFDVVSLDARLVGRLFGSSFAVSVDPNPEECLQGDERGVRDPGECQRCFAESVYPQGELHLHGG
jgi:hypothetical protein